MNIYRLKALSPLPLQSNLLNDKHTQAEFAILCSIDSQKDYVMFPDGTHVHQSSREDQEKKKWYENSIYNILCTDEMYSLLANPNKALST